MGIYIHPSNPCKRKRTFSLQGFGGFSTTILPSLTSWHGCLHSLEPSFPTLQTYLSLKVLFQRLRHGFNKVCTSNTISGYSLTAT
jgi:hypothetical protein